jgi:hypothetical protein
MGSLSERWAAFSTAAGPRRYVLGGLFTLAIAISDTVRVYFFGSDESILNRVPSWMFAIVFALALISFWFLDYLAVLRRRISGARFELAKLRTEGVAIRLATLLLTLGKNGP